MNFQMVGWISESSDCMPLCHASTGLVNNNTAGTWNQVAVELVQEIGRRSTLVTEDSRETVFLYQRLSIALQRGNAVSFLSTFTATD